MKLKDQVLSIEQVQELRELGFNVSKYASMGWVTTNQEDFELNTLDKCKYLICIPTLTIGDIMECLPEEIEENVLTIFAFGGTWAVGWEDIHYYGRNTLIDALFEILKWCIKQKHIEL